MKRLLPILLLLISGTIFSQGTGQFDRSFPDSIDVHIRQFMLTYKIAGAGVAVFQHDRVLLKKEYGFTDLQNKVRADEQSVFRIASVTKVFTALAVMQLAEAGKVDLQAPIEQYLPTLRLQYGPGMRKITVRDLLTHTAGLPDAIEHGSQCQQPPAQEKIIELVNREVLTIPPGLKKIYSNSGYALLGCLVERVSGQTYDDYLRQHIFNPLQMSRTSVSEAAAWTASRAKGYFKDSTELYEPLLRDVAAGGVESSTTDMTTFAQMILNQGAGPAGALVSKKTFAQMSSNQIGDIVLKSDDRFGYGLFIKYLGTTEDEAIGYGLGHAGDMRTHHALLMVYPKIDLGIVVLTNSEQGSTFANVIANKIIKAYVKTYKGLNPERALPARFSERASTADKIDHQRLSGIYGGGGDDYIRIKRINKNKLRFIQAGNTLVLKRDDRNLYTVKYMLLKFIPIKVKEALFAFREEQGRIYLKTLSNKAKQAEYVSMKDPDGLGTAAWMARQGNYEIVDLLPGNASMQPVALKCLKNNKIVLYRKDPFSTETDNIGFYALNETVAIADGIDRGAGATLKIMPNGHLYYSGFELKKTPF